MKEQKIGKSHKYEIDMCNGPLLGKILIFALPLILSGILQLTFNAVDIAVVGRFAGNTALAAVGATSSFINMLVNIFIGLSVGANVLVARFYGANQKKDLKEMVHTAIATAFASGALLIFLGFFLARPILGLMGTPEDVIGGSVLYMRIIFAGMPFFMSYNYGSAILRAIGDTKRPLYYLLLSGVVNVLLNLLFVVVFSMEVAGVALATIISQGISAFLVIRSLTKSEGVYRLIIKELKIFPDKLLKMVQIGIPAGLQGALFSISNMLIQSSINGFGSIAMAGNTASSNLEGFTFTAMNSMHQAAVSFTGQNYGASKHKRIGKTLFICLALVIGVGLLLGNLTYLSGAGLLRLYTTEDTVIQYGMLRLKFMCTTFFLCGMQDVVVGSLRGMGYSVMPMLVSLAGACGFRILWIYTVFARIQTLESLYVLYPITWGLIFIVQIICFFIIYKKFTDPRITIAV